MALNYTYWNTLSSWILFWDGYIASKKNWASDQVIQEIRRWYNGYRFSKQDVKVYNPWSTLSLFQSGDFQEHWYTTGIPKMLVDVINRDPESFSNSNPADFDELSDYNIAQIDTYDIEQLQLIPLMLQTGFLTLKGYDEDLSTYQLGYPNFEVRQAFSRMVLDTRLTQTFELNPLVIPQKIRKYLRERNMEAVIAQLNALLASIPGILHIPREAYYHSLIHMIFQASGLTIRSEEWVAGGRIDTVIEEPDCFYIIEFKFGATAQVAIDQIKHRKYSDKFKSGSLPIFALGIAVDCETKSILEWKLEQL